MLDVLPVAFLKLAQNQAGESDFVFSSLSSANVSYSGDVFLYSSDAYDNREGNNNFTFPLINATEMYELTKDSDDFEGFTARWFGVAKFRNTTNEDLHTSGIIMALDTEREVKIGLGRDFTKTLLGKRQVFMTSSTLRYLDIRPNGRDEVELYIDIRDYLTILFDTNQELTSDDIQSLIDELGFNTTTNDTVTIKGSDLVNSTDLESKQNITVL